MVDHSNPFKPEKQKLRSIMRTFNLFMSEKKKQTIHESVSNSGNPVIQIMYKIVNDAMDSISPHTRMSGRSTDNRYRDIFGDMMEFVLNIWYTDTAYRDIGDYILLQMYQPENAEKILSYLEKYQPDIKNCYYNNWEKFKGGTREMEEKGLLERGQLSDNEMLLVDSAIQGKVNKWKKENF